MADVEMNSGSDDSGMEDHDEEIQKMKKKLSDDERNIIAANELLELLRKNGDFEELNEKRKEFVEWAPLNAQNWKWWIEDEIAKPDANPEEIEKMFEKALFDDNDVAIWVDRIFYAKTVSDELCKRTCENALSSIGNRYDAGGHIWWIFLGYEKDRLKNFLESPDLTKRISQVIALYQRALRCATTQLEEIYQEAEVFCENTNNKACIPDLKKIFETTLKQKKQLDEFEKVICGVGTHRQGLKAFYDYEKKSGMPARIQNAHERLVSELDYDEEVWSAYGTWTENVLKLPQVSVEVYDRAIRHCPLSYVLHQQALLAYERAKRPDEVIDALWEKAKQNVINSAEEGRGLYRTYIYLIRRRIVASGSKDYSPMAEIFDEGSALLKEWFTTGWDPTTEFRQMQAWFYADLMNDMTKVRNIWNDILASGSGRFAAKWIEAVRLERQFGDNENARKYLNKALNSVSDNINEIYVYYVQFEREEGTLAELDLVLEKVNSQVAHRAARPTKIEAPKKKEEKKDIKRNSGGEPIVKKVKDNDGGFKAPLPPTFHKKAGASTASGASAASASASGAPTSSRAPAPPATKAAPGTEDARTVFVSNLEFTTTEDDIRQAIQGVASVRFARKAHTDQTHRGFAYVVLETEQLARQALLKDRVPVKGRPMFISINDPEKRVGFKYATGLEKSKIFVRNVHFQATDEELVTLFSQFGPITSVRRVTHKDGKPKGMAYVDFKTEEDAKKCVGSEEKLMLRERELTVALSDPPRKEGRAPGKPKEAEMELGPRKGHAAKLQMLPRALANKAPPGINMRSEDMDTSDGPSTSSGLIPTSKPLSNDQFRQFLMKKQ